MSTPPHDAPTTGSDGNDAGGTAPSAPIDHDPTGLDLARQLTSSLPAGPAPAKRPRKRRRASPKEGSRDPEPFSAVLDDLIRSEGWDRDIAVQAVFGRWAELVGHDIAQHSKPERLEDKVLTVRTDSTAWASSLRMVASQLVARLNDELGQGEVRSVRVLGPDAPSWKHGRRSVRDGRGPRDTYG
jgi:predicted nucleic acid-binding Zn ribbon protein